LFAVGHMALAYLLGKGSSKLLGVNLNVPLIMMLALVPDGDLLILPDMHRGPAHSIIVAFIAFLPLFAIYRKKAVPYFLGLASHAAIADVIAGGELTLLWPLTEAQFGLTAIAIDSVINVTLELALFSGAALALFKSGDFRQFLQPRITHLVRVVPIVTVLLPSAIAYPLVVPPPMLPPHLFYLALFSIAILAALYGATKQILPKNNATKKQTHQSQNPA